MKTKPKPWTSMSADERKLLVATTIFGWKAEKRKRYGGVDNVKGWGLNQHLHRGDNDRHFVTDGFFLPAWPTAIESAFEVVEKIPDGIQITCYGTRYVVQNLGMSGAPFIGQGNLPELICLAALRAHGVEVE